MDFASMYPTPISSSKSGPSTFSGVTFKGTGTILEIPNSGGQAKVYPDSNAHPLSVGDFIIDTKSGRQAMLGTNKKWYLIC